MISKELPLHPLTKLPRKFLNWKQAQYKVGNCSKMTRMGEKGKQKKRRKNRKDLKCWVGLLWLPMEKMLQDRMLVQRKACSHVPFWVDYWSPKKDFSETILAAMIGVWTVCWLWTEVVSYATPPLLVKFRINLDEAQKLTWKEIKSYACMG